MLAKIRTSIGDVEIKKAEIEDKEAVLAIMRDAAKWLEAKGIHQWTAMLSEKGQDIVNQRIGAGLSYIADLNGEKIGTVSIQWTDKYGWGEKGMDGSAGYIHGLAIFRRFEGKKVGLDILKWAIHVIAAEKPKVRLDCMVENPRLCRIYEKMGFNLVGANTLGYGFKVNLYEKF